MAETTTDLVTLLRLSDAELAAWTLARCITYLRAGYDTFPLPGELHAPEDAAAETEENTTEKKEQEDPAVALATLPDVLTGTDVRAWREHHLLSQARLAQNLGCGGGTLSQWENGVKPMSLKTQDKIRQFMATYTA